MDLLFECSCRRFRFYYQLEEGYTVSDNNDTIAQNGFALWWSSLNCYLSFRVFLSDYSAWAGGLFKYVIEPALFAIKASQYFIEESSSACRFFVFTPTNLLWF